MDEDMKDFLDSFGITAPPAGDDTDPPSDPPSDPPATDPPQDPPGSEPPATDPASKTDPAQNPANDKQTQAFAAMRVENSTLKNTLQSVAAVLGITETKDLSALSEAIKVKALEAQAKQQNVPVEMLQKLDRLENLEQQFTATQLQTQAAIGFQKVAEQFKLGNEELVAFAQSLLADGLNPYEKQVDLVKEYRDRNWETIINQAVETAVRAEQERAAKAGKASDPGTEKGGVPGAQDKITTIKDLDSLISKW